MAAQIGQELTLNGKSYKITGKEGRSFLLSHGGQTFKATQDKIDKILAQNSRPKVEFPYLEQRLAFKQLINKSAKLPESEEEIFQEFTSLTGQLSGENLHADGEATPSQIRQKLIIIRGTWAELERKLGRRVSEEEVERKFTAPWRNK